MAGNVSTDEHGMYDVAVVGAGIAGLAAAFELTRRLLPERVVLVEKDGRLGGKLRTEHVQGFTVEGGPDSFLASKPAGLELCRDLGIETTLEGPDPNNRRTFVLRDGVLVPMPEGLSGMVPARLGPMFRSPLFSPRAKARLALDFVRPAGRNPGDESLANFVERRLGREVYERLVEPLMAGIYAGDGRALSLAATFPHLRDTEVRHGSLMRGLRAAHRRAGAPRHTSPFLAPPGGMEEIATALEGKLSRIRILRSSPAVSIRAESSNWIVELPNGAVRTGAVVIATPAPAAADLLADLDSDLAASLRAIPHVSTATVSVAYRAEAVVHRLNGYGYIIPRREGRPVLACTWVSSKWPSRAPEGSILLRAFVGRAGQEQALETDDDRLLEIVLQEFRATLGIRTAPILHRVFRWSNAMPQYTLGHLQRLEFLRARLDTMPGLYLAGNAYRGIGIPDCIRSGREAAERAASSV